MITIAAICLVISAFLPAFYKTLFVEPSGNLKILSPWIAAVLILGFVYRRSWARKATLILCKIAFLVLAVVLLLKGFDDYRSYGLLFLLLLQVVCITIMRDEEVRTFFGKRPDNARIHS